MDGILYAAVQCFARISVFGGAIIQIHVDDFVRPVQLVKADVQRHFLPKIPPATQLIVIVQGWLQYRHFYPSVQFRYLWRGKTYAVVSIKALALSNIIGKANLRT